MVFIGVLVICLLLLVLASFGLSVYDAVLRVYRERKKQENNPKTWLARAVLIIIFAAVLGVAFWWFSYRPSNIRKECYSSVYSKNPNLGSSDARSRVNALYEGCLRSHGL